MKRTPLRPRSKKRQKLYREKRTPFVAKFLAKHRWCQRCLEQPCIVSTSRPWGNQVRRSTVVHEKLTRARGGDILDPENCVALCNWDHQFIHNNPMVAECEGFLIPRSVGKAGIPIANEIQRTFSYDNPTTPPWRTDPAWCTEAIQKLPRIHPAQMAYGSRGIC